MQLVLLLWSLFLRRSIRRKDLPDLSSRTDGNATLSLSISWANAVAIAVTVVVNAGPNHDETVCQIVIIILREETACFSRCEDPIPVYLMISASSPLSIQL